MSAIAIDPLIAEAKERARRRRLAALGAVVVAVAALGTTLATRSSTNSLGICATRPSGWKEQTVRNPGPVPGSPTVALTNFRFGRMDDLYGFGDPGLRWPPNGVTVVVVNSRRIEPSEHLNRPLRVARADFGPFEGVTAPFALLSSRSNGRLLDAYVKVGVLTPATIAAANAALAGVRTCSA